MATALPDGVHTITLGLLPRMADWLAESHGNARQARAYAAVPAWIQDSAETSRLSAAPASRP